MCRHRDGVRAAVQRTTWLMGSDRLMAIGALAGSGRSSSATSRARFGTPIVVNVLSGLISDLLFIVLRTGGGLAGLLRRRARPGDLHDNLLVHPHLPSAADTAP